MLSEAMNERLTRCLGPHALRRAVDAPHWTRSLFPSCSWDDFITRRDKSACVLNEDLVSIATPARAAAFIGVIRLSPQLRRLKYGIPMSAACAALLWLVCSAKRALRSV